jgi:hypothetical protein
VVTLAINTRKNEVEFSISNTYGYDSLRFAGFPLETMLVSEGDTQFLGGDGAQYRLHLTGKVCLAHVCIIPNLSIVSSMC